jgi:hypothetical protein
MKGKKKTDRSPPKRFLSVGPITSRETIGPINIRSALNIKIKQCIKRKNNAERDLKRYTAAMKELLK